MCYFKYLLNSYPKHWQNVAGCHYLVYASGTQQDLLIDPSHTAALTAHGKQLRRWDDIMVNYVSGILAPLSVQLRARNALAAADWAAVAKIECQLPFWVRSEPKFELYPSTSLLRRGLPTKSVPVEIVTFVVTW